MAVHEINFAAMLAQLMDNLEVEAGDSYHTGTNLKRYINLGIIEMAKRTKIVHKVKFLHLSANVARYTCASSWLYGHSRQVLYLKSGSLSGSQYTLDKLDRPGFQSAMSVADTASVFSAVIFDRPATGYPTKYLLDGNVIEFRPIPTASTAGANRICFKFPGIPDALSATSAVPGIPLEHRMVAVTFATYLGQMKDKDLRAPGTLNQFKAECAEIEADIKWADQEEPPVMHVEEY